MANKILEEKAIEGTMIDPNLLVKCRARWEEGYCRKLFPKEYKSKNGEGYCPECDDRAFYNED